MRHPRTKKIVSSLRWRFMGRYARVMAALAACSLALWAVTVLPLWSAPLPVVVGAALGGPLLGLIMAVAVCLLVFYIMH